MVIFQDLVKTSAMSLEEGLTGKKIETQISGRRQRNILENKSDDVLILYTMWKHIVPVPF